MHLAIANQKGGVGKTTTAIQLGESMAMAGFRCLLVDLDPQGNATTGLGIGKCVEGGIVGRIRGLDVVAISPTSAEGLFLSPGSGELVREEARAGSADGRAALLGALRSVSEGFDVVLVDCPPALGALTRGALAWAEAVLIPLQCEFFAMEGLAEMLRVVEVTKNKENPGLRLVRVLPTMFDPSMQFHQEVVQDLRRTLGETVCRTVVPRDIVLAEASSHGVPIVAYDCLSRAAHAYVQLSREVAQHGGEAIGKRLGLPPGTNPS